MKSEISQALGDAAAPDTPAVVSMPRDRAAQLASGLSQLATWGRGYNAALAGKRAKRRRVPWVEDAADLCDALRNAASGVYVPDLGSLPGFVAAALSYPAGRAAMRAAFPALGAPELDLGSVDASPQAALRPMMDHFGELAKGAGALACSPVSGYVAVSALRRALDLVEAQTDEPHAWLSNPGGPQLLAARTRDGCHREIAGKGDDWCTPYPVWTSPRATAEPFAPTPGSFAVGKAQAGAAWVGSGLRVIDRPDGMDLTLFLQSFVAFLAKDRGAHGLVSAALTQRAATALGDFIVDHRGAAEARPLDEVGVGEGGEAYPRLGVEESAHQPGAGAGFVAVEGGRVVGWARTPEGAAENGAGPTVHVVPVVASFGNLDPDAVEVAGWVSAHPDRRAFVAHATREGAAQATSLSMEKGWSDPQPFFLQAPPRLEADWPRFIPESMAEAYAGTWRRALQAGNDYPGAARAVLAEFILSHRPPAVDRTPAAYRSRAPGEPGTRLWAGEASAYQAAGRGGEVEPLFTLPPGYAPLFAGYFVERWPYEGQAGRDVEVFATAEQARRFVTGSIFKDWRDPEPVYRGSPTPSAPYLPPEDLALLRSIAQRAGRGEGIEPDDVEGLRALVLRLTVPAQA